MTDSNLVWMRLLYSRAYGRIETTETQEDARDRVSGKRLALRFWGKR